MYAFKIDIIYMILF